MMNSKRCGYSRVSGQGSREHFQISLQWQEFLQGEDSCSYLLVSLGYTIGII